MDRLRICAVLAALDSSYLSAVCMTASAGLQRGRHRRAYRWLRVLGFHLCHSGKALGLGPDVASLMFSKPDPSDSL